MVAGVVGLALAGAPVLAQASPDASTPAVISERSDAESLLGGELLGLDPEIVEALLSSDPDFALVVSQGLRSGDPYVIEATVQTIADRAGQLDAGAGAGVVLHQTGHSVVVLAQTGIRSAPIRLQSQIYGIAVKFQDFVPAQSTTAILGPAEGLHREQLVSAIHAALSEE